MSTRAERLRRLVETEHDILILGGGINGAGVARDLMLRARVSGTALNVALVDKGHFSSGTSGKNSQLIHGGLRYLKYGDFRLVHEALGERATLLEIAPHLVEPLPMLIPMYSLFDRVFYGTGLYLYDFLSGKRNIGRHRGVSKDAIRAIEPGLSQEGLAGGAIFYDARVHSARLVLENLREAEDGGAVLCNYLGVSGVRRDGAVWVCDGRDELTGETFTVRAKGLVNTTGPWSGGLFPQAGTPRLVRGSHIILPRLNRSDNAVSYFGSDGRIIFFIPWGSRDHLTLVGTTDVDHEGGPDAVGISAKETEYLRAVAAKVFPESRGMEPVAAYSSLRPLLQQNTGSATAATREHRIWKDEAGIVHVTGGKYTTYRVMAEEAADLIAPPALASVHETARHPLNGNSPSAVKALLASAASVEEKHVVKDYGVRAPVILERARVLGSIEAARREEAWSREWVEKEHDFLFVSTYLGHEGV